MKNMDDPEPEELKRMSTEERHRKFPMGLGLFPMALPYFRQWRHLRWFLLFWLPNLISFLLLLPNNDRLMEHILLAVLSPVVLAFAFYSFRSGVASSNDGTFFRGQEPVRFWISTAVPTIAYIGLTVAYYVL